MMLGKISTRGLILLPVLAFSSDPANLPVPPQRIRFQEFQHSAWNGDGFLELSDPEIRHA